LLERVAGPHAAAEVYRNALKIAPATPSPPLAAAISRAEAVIAAASQDLEERIFRELETTAAACTAPARARFEESVRIFSGRAKAYNSEPLLLHYPRLPAIPFYDRSHFPWLEELEAATDTIRGELEAALARDTGFAPYIDYPPDAPVNQWAELNHSSRWSSYFLWRDGEPQAQACADCPQTAALMDRLPLARQPGFAPTVVFSALAPHTHIPPHTGSTNARLLVHLPLILPGPARFRVGNEVRSWRMGEAWAFDDTIEHEAWNDADALRVILIIDTWNPYLEPAERDLVSAMLAIRRDLLAGKELGA
jgi:aspartyl/asparaginyl beta-hydroxylase (cupin superfamily)